MQKKKGFADRMYQYHIYLFRYFCFPPGVILSLQSNRRDWRSLSCNHGVIFASFMLKSAKHRAANRFRLLYSSTLPHTNRLEERKNYKIDSTDDKEKDQKNPVDKKSSRKGPFSTCGIRLYKKWPKKVKQEPKTNIRQ